MGVFMSLYYSVHTSQHAHGTVSYLRQHRDLPLPLHPIPQCHLHLLTQPLPRRPQQLPNLAPLPQQHHPHRLRHHKLPPLFPLHPLQRTLHLPQIRLNQPHPNHRIRFTLVAQLEGQVGARDEFAPVVLGEGLGADGDLRAVADAGLGEGVVAMLIEGDILVSWDLMGFAGEDGAYPR